MRRLVGETIKSVVIPKLKQQLIKRDKTRRLTVSWQSLKDSRFLYMAYSKLAALERF